MKRNKKFVIAVYTIIALLSVIFWLLAFSTSFKNSDWGITLSNLSTELAGIFILFLIVNVWFLTDEFMIIERIDKLLDQLEFSGLLQSLNDVEIKDSLYNLLKVLNSLKKEKLPVEYGIFKSKLLSELSILSMHSSNKYTLPFQMRVKDIQKVFIGYMGLLRDGNMYYTVTNLDFWKNNLADSLTLLYENINAAKNRKVKIYRIFIVNKHFNDLPDNEKNIINQHQIATEENKNIKTKIIIESDKNTLNEKFSICEDKSSEGTVVLKMKGRETIQEGEIKYTSIEISKFTEDITHYKLKFNELFNKAEAISINEYVNLNK